MVSVTNALKSGDKVTLIGFGTFEISNRAARVGRNPKTGTEIKIEATKLPKFKAGKTFKEAVLTKGKAKDKAKPAAVKPAPKPAAKAPVKAAAKKKK